MEDKEQIARLIAREIPALRRYATALAGTQARDDLVQDTLLKAVAKCDSWRRDGSIKSWLFGIMCRTFLNDRRRIAARREIAGDGIEDFPAAPGLAPDRRLEYAQALEALNRVNPLNREALFLVAVEGLSCDQAAHIMNISVGAVRSRVCRAREELRIEMESRNRTRTVPYLRRVK